MTRNFLNSTGRAAVLAAFLLGVSLLAGARAQGNGQALVQTPEPKRDGPMWLRIMAFADAPVVGAEVRVSVYGRYGWPLVDVPAATNQYGVFPVAVPSRLSSFRVTVSGGTINGQPFPGRLSRDIVLTDPAHQIVVINPVTTLVSRLLDARPELQLEQAEALVRHLLKLPENYSLGLALQQSSHYVSPFFSPVAFMAEARAAGGLDTFLQLLLQELASPSAGHPFRPPQLLPESRSPSAGHPFRPPQLLGSTVSSDDVSISSDAISVMKTGLYAGLLDVASAEGVGNLAGWALSYTNLATPGAVGADIAGLQQSLNDLQSSIDSLSSQVGQLTQLVQAIAVQNTQTQYIFITTTAQTLANQVNDMENRLMYLTKDCPPLPDGSTSTPPDPGSFCDTEPGLILTALSSEPIYSSYTNVESYVQDNSTTLGINGMIHLYSLWLSQSKRFFRPADSTKMQNLYDYWDGVLTQAADLKVELLHRQKEQDAGGATLMGFMGNPDATPPTTGTFQLNETANLKLMFPAVPLETVVDTKTRLMWMMINLPAPGTAPDDTQYECQDDGVYGPSGIRTPPSVAGGPNLNYYSWNGFTNWTAPGIQDLQTLVDGGGNNPMGWLIDQTKAVAPDSPQSPGFPNIVQAGTTGPTEYVCSSQTAVWSRDSAPPGPNAVIPYYVFNFSNGATELPQYSNNTGYRYWVFFTRPVDEKNLEQYYFYQ